MDRTPVPIGSFTRRVPTAGRIRLGAKGPKGQPQSLSKFRFTSADEGSLKKIAEKCGGDVRPWNPGKGRQEFELFSDAAEIDVVVPPNALGGTPIYEQWSNAGLIRRCDGESCMAMMGTQDGMEMADNPCICLQKQNMECTPVTRVNLLLPDIPFNGMWMLETKGWNAAHELPGMVEMVAALGERGLTRAVLAIEKRTSTSGGQTRHFTVPVIRTPATLEQIVAGAASLIALDPGGSSERLAITAPVDPDDEVADAEIVEEDQVLLKRVFRLTMKLAISTDDLNGFVFVISDGMCEGIKALGVEELGRLVDVLEKLDTGELEYVGLEGRRAVVRRKDTSAS